MSRLVANLTLGQIRELHFAGVDTRLRAMQFRRDPLPTEVHILGGEGELRDLAWQVPVDSVIEVRRA